MKKGEDRDLGMDRPISRRQFINGVLVGAGGVMLAGGAISALGCGGNDAGAPAAGGGTSGASQYPPQLTGFQGTAASASVPGHALRDGNFWDRYGDPEPINEHYDLVVVGAGISGLSAAHFFIKENGPGTRVLLVDANNDFGGHAARNEYTAANGRKIIGYGGSQSMDGPGNFSDVAHGLLRDVGIRYKKFYKYFDQDLYEKRRLNSAIFFTEEIFGKDHLAIRKPDQKAADLYREAPLHPKARKDLARLIDSPPDFWPDLSDTEKKRKLVDMTYLDFLTKVAKVHPDVVKYLFDSSSGWFAIGIDQIGAQDAWIAGYPGLEGLGLEWTEKPPYGVGKTNLSYWKYWNEGEEPYIFHFPDGNHGIARALVRKMIPSALAGKGMEDLVTEKLDYGMLDHPDNDVRIRLNSTAVLMEHDGDPGSARRVKVAYARDGKVEQVTAGNVIYAGWHAVAPYIAPDLGEPQREALASSFKMPMIYSNVLIRNWKAFDRMKLQSVKVPGSYWGDFGLDFPVSMGEYRFSSDPAQPVLVHFGRGPASLVPSENPRAGAAEARAVLEEKTFEDAEREMRSVMGRALADGGFDPARDIEAITVNRWPHGYAYEYMRPADKFWPEGPLPSDIASRRHGRIAFAGTDAAMSPWAHVAMDEGHRAVHELLR